MTTSVSTSRLDLAAEIRAALCSTPHFLSANISAELHDDEVVLQGSVGSYYQKQLAQESLRAIDGVNRVRNELKVAAPPRRPMIHG